MELMDREYYINNEGVRRIGVVECTKKGREPPVVLDRQPVTQDFLGMEYLVRKIIFHSVVLKSID